MNLALEEFSSDWVLFMNSGDRLIRLPYLPTFNLTVIHWITFSVVLVLLVNIFLVVSKSICQ